MPEIHVSDEQLTAYRDGMPVSADISRHLSSCRECQGRLGASRMMKVLLTPPEASPSPHPTPEQLAAYVEGTLKSMNEHVLEAHVAACSQCFADLEIAREFGRASAVPVKVGTLLIRWLQDTIAVKLAPFGEAPSRAASMPMLALDVEDRAGHRNASADVMLPSPMILDRAETFRKREVDPEALFQELRRAHQNVQRYSHVIPQLLDHLKRNLPEYEQSIKDWIAELNRLAELHLRAAESLISLQRQLAELRVKPQQDRVSNLTEVPVGQYQLQLQVRGRSPKEISTLIRIIEQSRKKPVRGVQVRVTGESVPPVIVKTDEEGEAEFRLRPGSVTVAFESPLDAELQITV